MNGFEVLSTFDQVDDTHKGIKSKMQKASKTNSEIEQRHEELDKGIDSMAAQLQAYINMKKEVDIMKSYTRNQTIKSKSNRATTDFL